MVKKKVVLIMQLSFCIIIATAQNKIYGKSFGGNPAESRSDKGKEENFCIENDVTAAFMKDVEYPNNDYSFTKITEYAKLETDYRKDLPAPVRIKVPKTDTGIGLILETYCDGEMVRSDKYAIGQEFLEIWNLIPQTSYTYKLYQVHDESNRQEIANGYFRTDGQVRMMNIEQIPNCRDLGGWALPNGCRVKYDKLFRSGELATLSSAITDAGIHELVNVQNIEVELDFSAPFSSVSPVSNHLEHVHGFEYEIMFYTTGLQSYGTEYKNCFVKTLNSLREGKKVLFHCIYGADRTGTFAFLLKGLLGVSESDLAKDYELTCFAWEDPVYRVADANGYGEMIDYIKRKYAGDTLNEKIENMALSFGIEQQDVDDFRKLMIETVETTPIESVTFDNSSFSQSECLDNSTNSPYGNVLFDLNGQRVDNPRSGIYIRNGHKVVIP